MKSIRVLLRSPVASALFISLTVFLAINVLRNTGNLEFLELTAYDWLTKLMPRATRSAPRITLIEVNDRDIQNLGRWPLTDAALAKALEILKRYHPRAIGVDIFRDVSVPPGREELETVLGGEARIIAVMKFGEGGIPPPEVLKGTDRVGFNDILVDPGGIVRRGLLFLDDGEKTFYSFPLRLALIYLQKEGIYPQADASNPDYLRLGKNSIKPFEANDGGYFQADARGYQFLLDYRVDPASFPSYSLSDLFEGRVNPQLIDDKIVLLGVKAEGIKDYFNTPLSRAIQTNQPVSGIRMHALIISQLLRLGLSESSTIKTLSEGQESLWILLWAISGGIVSLYLSSTWRFVLSALIGLLSLGFIAYSALWAEWWIPLIPPALGWLLSLATVTAYVSGRENKERLQLMQIFSKHVSPEVAESIWRQRERLVEGGHVRPRKLICTTLFSDLVGFSPLAEQMDPMELIEWLNVYMDRMTRLVMEHGGIVDDYAGDGLKASFGLPLPRSNEEEIKQDAVNAVRCALSMEREMKSINLRWRQQNFPTIRLRIGIFTGPLVAGSIGSSERMKYTTLGNTVNIASRLESYEKDRFEFDLTGSPCRILIGEATQRYLNSKFKVQKIGEARLKGQSREITIYRVLQEEDRG